MNSDEQLNYIIANNKLNSALVKTKNANISPWLVIDKLHLSVYLSCHYINNPLYQVHVRSCRTCNVEFSLGTEKNNPIIKKNCTCGDDGLKRFTQAKLAVFFDDAVVKQILGKRRITSMSSFREWADLDLLTTPVYISRSYVGNDHMRITSRNCRLCNTEFDLHYQNSELFGIGYVVKKKCECGSDGKKMLTKEKLYSYFDESKSNQIVESYNLSKTKGFETTEQYWLLEGKTTDEAKVEISRINTERSAKSPSTVPGTREYSVRCHEFWMRKYNMTEEQAKEKVNEYQIHNGLEWSISQYGVDEGPLVFEARMENWNSKMATSVKTGKSKISNEMFALVDDDRGGYYAAHEKLVKCQSKVYRVDYLFGNHIIEFFGDYWHADPRLYSAESVMIGGKLASELWIRDERKIADLRTKGYNVLVVWEQDYKKDPEAIINQCKQFLENNK